jgi:ELWxxDGT repeat protein
MRKHLCTSSTIRLGSERLERRELLSAVPQMLSSAEEGYPAYQPEHWAGFGDKVFLAGEVDRSGAELLILEGDGSSPRLVKDIFPGASSSDPRDFVEMDGIVYFVAENAEFGQELWRTDGTSAGTRLVYDVSPGPAWSKPSKPTVIGNHLFFAADDGVHGREVWVSDGTTAGTLLVKDIAAGAASSNVNEIVAYKDAVFFAADDLVRGKEFWRAAADGSDARIVRDLYSGAQGSSPYSLTVYKDLLFFTTGSSSGGSVLWQTDGTIGGFETVYRATDPNGGFGRLFEVNGKLFFHKNNILWVSDGTTAGTFSHGVSGGYVYGELNGKFVWSGAWDLLYQWDGTAENPPEVLAEGVNLIFGDGFALFTKQDATGRSLWKTQGVRGDAVKLMDYPPSVSESQDGLLVGIAFGKAYFAMHGDTGKDLWSTSIAQYGAASLVGAVYVRYAQFLGASPPTEYQDDTYLITGGFEQELLRTDGTARGTSVVYGGPAFKDGYIAGFASTSIGLLLGRDDGVLGMEPWISDGTPAGLRMLKDIAPGATPSYSQLFGDLGGVVLFLATDPDHGGELWRTDGTSEGTVLVKDINPGPPGSGLNQLVVLNGIAYFPASDGGSGKALWRSDGTPDGTYRVAELEGPREIVMLSLVGGRVYFSTFDASGTYSLWRSDGTAETTVRLQNFGAGDNLYPGELTAVGSRVFFAAADPQHGRELWVTDGTPEGTRMVADINPSTFTLYDFGPRYLVESQGMLYFSADDGVYGRELWQSDGTLEGTVLVKDIYPGSQGSFPSNSGQLDGRFVFAANDGVHGIELWVSDGTAAGTTLFCDVNPGIDGYGYERPRDSSPEYVGLVNGHLLFTAIDNAHGRQLRSLPYKTVELPGDADLDGDVDLTDFGILKEHFGTGTTRAEGDFNGDGRVDLSDFGILKAAFGTAIEEDAKSRRRAQV